MAKKKSPFDRARKINQLARNLGLLIVISVITFDISGILPNELKFVFVKIWFGLWIIALSLRCGRLFTELLKQVESDKFLDKFDEGTEQEAEKPEY